MQKSPMGKGAFPRLRSRATALAALPLRWDLKIQYTGSPAMKVLVILMDLPSILLFEQKTVNKIQESTVGELAKCVTQWKHLLCYVNKKINNQKNRSIIPMKAESSQWKQSKTYRVDWKQAADTGCTLS